MAFQIAQKSHTWRELPKDHSHHIKFNTTEQFLNIIELWGSTNQIAI